MSPLPRSFFEQNAVWVARDLLGARLVRRMGGRLLVGKITETEAYSGFEDAASHAHRGKTPRNLPMWEAPGHAYVYFIYGMYWLLNVTCEPADQPAAVLIRALEALEDLPPHTHGPGRLTRALGIDGNFNRLDLTTTESGLWIEAGESIPDEQVNSGARVGLGKHVPEPWRSHPWRFWVANHAHRPRQGSCKE
jgi:DNA-3-methyladenine glycosylase